MLKSSDSLGDPKIANFRNYPDTPGKISQHSGLKILVRFRGGFGAKNGDIFGIILNMLGFGNVCFNIFHCDFGTSIVKSNDSWGDLKIVFLGSPRVRSSRHLTGPRWEPKRKTNESC